ncbi:MAG: phytanoyl-CoA dioxygenase family protein [Acidimicrobiales bacterium]
MAGALPRSGRRSPRIPEIAPDQFDAETVRRNILGHGSVCVRGLFDDDQVATCVDGIDQAFAVRDAGPGTEVRRTTSWFKGLRLPPDEAQSLGRHWVSAAGGMLTVDSPKMLFRLLEVYAAVGLHEVVRDFFGERPVLSANKWTLRRVPLTASTDWHQDGAFLGEGIRALNVWVALSDCGDDSPGMDLLPRRLDRVVETGTGGAIFDWAVGPAVVAELAVDAPVVRPLFKAGDALIFDDLFLHRTAIEPTMVRPRYALEAWFFAPSVYPEGQVPIVW